MIACGTGRRVINPELGHNICGYGNDYPNEGVHDDICATALYLHDGKQDAVFIVFDLIGLVTPTIARVRAAVARATGVPAERVFLHCTHVHSAPDALEDLPIMPQPNPGVRADYVERVIAWAAEAARDAKADAEPCELRYNATDVACNMNRRFTYPDRRYVYIPDHKQLIGQSREYVDRELGIVAFRRVGSPNRYKAVITNYTCHPLCVGNSSNLISADFQGALRRTVEATFAGARCLTTTGAAGDNHPLTPEAGFAAAERMGGELGSATLMRAYDAATAEDDALRLDYHEVALRFKDDATRAFYPSAAARALRLPTGGADLRTHVSLLGIGPVLFAGFPGEPMAELGAQLKWSSPFLKSYAMFTSTDCLNYFPTTNQLRYGGYEAETTWFARGEGDRLVRTIVDRADALLAARPLRLRDLDAAASTGKAR